MFLVCGEALFDFFLEAEHGPGQASYDARAGGSPFNVAIGLARLERAAGLVTGISTDLLGQRLRQVLENEAVSTHYAVTTGRPSTISLVGLDTQGVAAYIFYDSGSAGSALSAAEMIPVGPEVTGLHFGSYSLVAGSTADVFADLAEAHRDRFISLDPNVRPTVEPDMEIWRQRLARYYPKVNLLKISAEDLEMLHPEMSHADFAHARLDDGVELVVVTNGSGLARGWMKGASPPPPRRRPPRWSIPWGRATRSRRRFWRVCWRGPRGPRLRSGGCRPTISRNCWSMPRGRRRSPAPGAAPTCRAPTNWPSGQRSPSTGIENRR